MIILMLLVVVAGLVFFEIYLKKTLWRTLMVIVVFLTSVFCSMKIGMDVGDAIARNVISENIDRLLKVLERDEDSKTKVQGDVLKTLTTRLPSALMNDREMVEFLNELENANGHSKRRQP